MPSQNRIQNDNPRVECFPYLNKHTAEETCTLSVVKTLVETKVALVKEITTQLKSHNFSNQMNQNLAAGDLGRLPASAVASYLTQSSTVPPTYLAALLPKYSLQDPGPVADQVHNSRASHLRNSKLLRHLCSLLRSQLAYCKAWLVVRMRTEHGTP